MALVCAPQLNCGQLFITIPIGLWTHLATCCGRAAHSPGGQARVARRHRPLTSGGTASFDCK